MYAAPSKAEKPFQLLPSGTPAELIAEKDGFVNIRLVNGKTGWVEKQFLEESKPAKVRLLALQSKYRQLQGQIDFTEKKLTEVEALLVSKGKEDKPHEPDATKEVLQAGLEKALEEMSGLREELEKQKLLEKVLRENVGSERALVEREVETSSNTSWFTLFLVLIFGAGAGVFLGAVLQDRKQLKRHGGFRL